MKIIDCQIIIHFTFRNHREEKNDYKDHFVSYPNFVNYMRWHPERAMLIGYVAADEVKLRASRSSQVKVSLWFRDEHAEEEIFFNDFADLTSYLESQPAIAQKLMYYRSKQF